MRIDFPVVGPYDKQRTVRFNAEDSVNWYIVIDERGKKPQMLVGTPGLLLAYNLGSASYPIRQLVQYNNDIYAVAGNSVYKNQTLLGTLATFVGYVDFAINNAGQIGLVDGAFGYIIDTVTVTLATITAPAFPLFPVGIAYLDGYFIVANGSSTQFNFSALNNGFSWDTFDFEQVQAYQGNLVGVAVVNRRIFFFKTTSTEVWFNEGGAGSPFRRDNNLIFNYGCLVNSTIESQYGVLFFLSQDESGISSVMASDGINVKKISWESIDAQIHQLTAPADVCTYIYKDDGHIFYVMSWTTDDITFVYDATTDSWHRMKMQPKKPIADQPNSAKTRHLSQVHCFANNQHYVGSYKDGDIYTMSLAYGDNNGEPIKRERVFRHFSSENYNYRQINMLQIDFQSGIGSNAGVDKFPQAYLSLSYNDGQSFGNEMSAPLGRLGSYTTRTLWRVLGIHRDFIAKVSIYSDVKPIYMLGGAIDYEELSQ